MALPVNKALYAIKAKYEDGTVQFWGNRHDAPFITERNAQKHCDWLNSCKNRSGSEYPEYTVIDLKLEVGKYEG